LWYLLNSGDTDRVLAGVGLLLVVVTAFIRLVGQGPNNTCTAAVQRHNQRVLPLSTAAG
jgi:hypothetical protein